MTTVQLLKSLVKSPRRYVCLFASCSGHGGVLKCMGHTIFNVFLYFLMCAQYNAHMHIVLFFIIFNNNKSMCYIIAATLFNTGTGVIKGKHVHLKLFEHICSGTSLIATSSRPISSVQIIKVPSFEGLHIGTEQLQHRETAAKSELRNTRMEGQPSSSSSSIDITSFVRGVQRCPGA